MLLGVGTVITILRPIETLWSAVTLVVGHWLPISSRSVGRLLARQEPGIMLVQQAPGAATARPGDLVATRTVDRDVHFGLFLDSLSLAGETWARIVRIEPDSLSDENKAALRRQLKEIGTVVRLEVDDSCRDAMKELQLSRVMANRGRLIGIVAPDTSLGTLYFEVTSEVSGIEEGRLVETRIAAHFVLYQVIAAVSREELLRERNTYGFARARARKIGKWNNELGRFESVRWIPVMNEPVLIVDEEVPEPDVDAVGYFPRTRYPVKVDLSRAVTHNTAILGILGSGKAMLALELVQRMMLNGIRVICLDITGEYAPRLKYCEQRVVLAHLKRVGRAGKNAWKQNVEDRGSVKPFTDLMTSYFRFFLRDNYLGRLLIVSPDDFEVWRQDSRMFNNTASMASPTVTEVTRIITEAALTALQEHGPSEEARACIVFEEGHSLVPEWTSAVSDGDRTASNGTAKAILQGRKYGLGCLLITQRTANVTKSILNQCNTVFALRIYDATGMEFLRNYIGDDFADVLSTLEDRNAIIFGRASSCADPVLIRLNDRELFLRAVGLTGP